MHWHIQDVKREFWEFKLVVYIWLSVKSCKTSKMQESSVTCWLIGTWYILIFDTVYLNVKLDENSYISSWNRPIVEIVKKAAKQRHLSGDIDPKTSQF